MPLFQYQILAEPLTVPESPLAQLQWRAVYPDVVWRRVLPIADHPYFGSGTGFAPVRVSQLPVEDVFQYGMPLVRESQQPVETIVQYALGIRRVRVSQLPVEIIYAFGCYVPTSQQSCPIDLPADPGGGDGCAADTFNDVG